MKDVDAREQIQGLVRGQQAFRQELIALVEAALRPVAVQAANAERLVSTVGAQIQHVEDQLQVLAIEGNETRDEVNTLRETLAQQSGLLSLLVTNLKGAMDAFTVTEPPVAMNRETRRSIERGQRRHS